MRAQDAKQSLTHQDRLLITATDATCVSQHQRVEVILGLFRSLNSSDVFEKTYTRQLAMRLLSKHGCSMPMEKRMAAAFKNECGESFSTLTEMMFASTEENENVVESFKATATKLPFTDFNFKVLEQKTWPIDSSVIIGEAGNS